jgi:hypothetical protein
VFAYLRSDFIRDYVQEFQSPVFRSESAMQYELLLFLALITTGWLVWRREIVGALWILFWAHNSLLSVRHVPLFMIVAAPWVASGLTELWRIWVEPAGKKTFRGIFSSLARDMLPGCRRSSVWIPLVAFAFVLMPSSVVRWPKDFPELKFPARIAQKHKEKLVARRTLTMDQWADYLIYHNYPRQRVFLDGRSDFFGKELGKEYLHMIQGRWDWETLLDKHRFELVLSPLDWPLTSLLKKDSRWRIVEDDGMAVLFEKVPSYQASRSGLSSSPGPIPEKKARSLPNEKTRRSRN